MTMDDTYIFVMFYALLDICRYHRSDLYGYSTSFDVGNSMVEILVKASSPEQGKIPEVDNCCVLLVSAWVDVCFFSRITAWVKVFKLGEEGSNPSRD